MGEKLIKPYEISVWEDKLTQIEGSDPAEYKLTETKLAIIGSDTMTGLNKVYNPVFHKKSNGEKTLSFSLKYRYFDPYSGSNDVVNPFAALLVNERKVKLHYDGQWYEFIIKDHSESSDGLEWTYSCTDAFILELSKNGYNITFDSELNNNQGTAKELAQKTLENTDWQVGDGDTLVQLIAEPIYKAVLVSTAGIEIINASENEDVIPGSNTDIYLFYSYIKNKNGQFVQFIIRDENKKYTIDDKNVITDTNFRIINELEYKNDGFYLEDTKIISFEEIETKFQANRLAYNQLTTYDPVMSRTVDRFQTEDGETEIYRYTDYEYTTSNVVMNYITNGENFNALEDGTLQGWNPYTDQINEEKVNKLSLVTKPEIGTGKSLADINTLSQIEGFLKIEPNGPLTIEGNKIYNTVYNSGIENHTSFIESIAQGQKFVFRWRAGEGTDINDLTPKDTLGLIVAKYTQDEPTRYGYYYKHIDPKDIILRFEGTPAILDNIISGGTIETTEDNTQIYVIDGVAQTPSTKYIYKVNETSYLWDGTTGQFVEKTNESKYLPYYYLTAETTQAISNKVLTNPTEKIGIFIYATQVNTDTVIDEQTQESKTVIVPIYIQDIQLTRFVPDASGEDIPVILGNVPTATSNSKEFYYIKPEEGMAAEDVNTYISLEELASKYSITSTIKPLYNESSEKNLSISISQSNCFNILQTIAETFECWVDIVVGHNPETGYITETNGKPDKYIYLREYAGKENWAGFKYGINLDTIERTVNSDEVVTKLIVDSSQSEYVDEGFISIMNAPSNPSGESYILNFDYYYSQELLNREEVEADKLQFITEVSNLNNDLKEKEAKRRDLEASLTSLGGNRNVYTELVTTAQDKKNTALLEFEELTGMSYEDYQKKHEELIIDDSSGSEGTEEDKEKQLTDEETIVDVIGELYVSSATINNYAGILTNIDTEYKDIRKQLYGSEDYNVEVSVVIDSDTIRHIIVELNDYLPGFTFLLENDETEYTSTVSKKYFDISSGATTITFVAPQGYTTVEGAQSINDAETIHYEITPTTETKGLIDEIKDIQDEKDELTNKFNNKYSRFIQEGTWNSTDYIDSELYYLDALQVSNTSAQPIVTYTINVVEVSRLEGLENYIFDTGDKTYVEDTEFFGWNKENIGTEENPEFIYTPAREEVIVSEIEWHLDEPDQTVITVQNYKTRFEDLFQRISATVQTVQYNEATYAKTSSLMDAQGTLNQNVLLDSLNNISGQSYSLTSDGSVIIDGDRVLIRNLQNPANNVIINSEGIRISSDGGQNWQTAIDGQGINIGTVYTGTLNTNEVIIGSRDNPSFRWDKSGISAYKTNGTTIIEGQTVPRYDLQTYVRYDEYGLYGIKDNDTFKAQSLEDVLDKAHFAVTWDGFFIKNSYPQGGKVEITSDNDFRVLNTINNQLNEKIKIGALEWKQENWHEGDPIYTDPATIPESIKQLGPSLYGIRIKNNAGTEVMKTDDQGNIHITGDITATSGHIGGMVVNNDSLTMDTIVLEPGVGIYSTVQTDNNPAFIISDTNGNATFNQITARGHIEAQTGTLGDLDVIDTITVGASGAIESSNWSTQNQTGWHIDDNGATFNNANVRGTITALQGDFLGQVNVGDKTSDHIIIDGINADIRSSNYQDGAGYGWVINKDGDAVFNNITARGAIKTAVFEYAEIQAVGGIFIFRPSSTIKAARVSGNNLILKVEKPALFAKAIYSLSEDTVVDSSKTYYIKGTSGYIIVDTPTGNPYENGYYEMHTEFQSWCKISNYTTDGTEPNVNNILLSNGLTHVYKVLDVNLSTAEVTLENGIQFINAIIQQDETTADVLIGLEGGALVDMGREDGSSNYGIGVNSSDNTVNLPRRAISLFETVIDPSKSPKVSYKYKGILGTLPALQYTGIDAQVSPLYHYYLEGTQGIYTDNMYLGDNKQYIAFYKDGNGDTQLRLVAKSFEILPDDSDITIDLGDSVVEQKTQYTLSISTTENTIEEEWSDTPYEESSGYYLWQRTYVKYAKGRIQYLPTEDGYYMNAGQPGPQGPEGSPGEDAVLLFIDSSNGNTFKNNSVSTTLTVSIFKGTTIITNIQQLRDVFGNTAYIQWYWKRMSDNTFHEISVDDPMLSNAGFTLTLTPDKVDIKVVFQCEIKTVDN